MLKPKELLDSAGKGMAGAAGGALVGVAVTYGGIAVAIMKALNVTWWSVALFIVLLIPPNLLWYAMLRQNRELRRRILFLTKKVARQEGHEHPDWDHFATLASVEVWQAVVMLFERDPYKYREASTGGGALTSIAAEGRNVLGDYLKIADGAIDVTLPVVKVRDVDGCRLTSLVRLRAFVKWARRQDGWDVSPLLAETAALSP